MASLQLPNCKKKSAAHKNGFEVLVGYVSGLLQGSMDKIRGEHKANLTTDWAGQFWDSGTLIVSSEVLPSFLHPSSSSLGPATQRTDDLISI